MSFPALDLAGFTRRTSMTSGEVSYLEQDSPGYLATRIRVQTSRIYGRLRKRYGQSTTASSLPFGTTAPLLIPNSPTNPAVSLGGRPTLGSYEIRIEVTSNDVLGGPFRWSSDGGISWTVGVTAASVSLGTTGLTVAFADASYDVTMSWTTATPIPEVILDWITTFVTWDGYQRRGVNISDPMMAALAEKVATTEAEVKEAADGKDGLIDLPSSDDTDSAVTTGFPLGYAEASPYVAFDIERRAGVQEDISSVRTG